MQSQSRPSAGVRVTDSAGAANQARPNLSLLKSKIRRSESGKNVLSSSMSSTTTSSVASAYDEEDGSSFGGGGGVDPVGDIRRSGRRSAPNQQSSHSGGGSNAYNNSNGEYTSSTAPNGSRNNPCNGQTRQQQKQSAYGSQSQYEEPEQAPQQQQQQQYGSRSRQQQQPAHQPPPQHHQQQQQQQAKRNVADSRFDDDPNAFGPGAFPSGGDDDGAPPADSGEQIQCPDCGRRFNPLPFSKHAKICAKVFLQKRKVFDSSQMRIAAVGDPELEKLAAQAKKDAAKQAARDKKAAAAGASAASAAANSKRAAASAAAAAPAAAQGGGGDSSWRDKSSAFRDAMKAARQYSQAVAQGKPLPPPVASAPDPSLVPCPHCHRSFNAKAADRHIPQCQNIRAKPTMLKRGAGGGGGVNGSTTAAPKGRSGKF